MHAVLCGEHVGGQAKVDEALEQRTPKPTLSGAVREHRGWQLTVIAHQNKMAAPANDRHKAAGFARLRGLIHQHDGESA